MECNYKEVNNLEEEHEEKIPWTPFNRQLLISSSAWVVYFLTGLSFGVPTVMIPQLRAAANSTDAVSEEMASWLSSIFGYSALPWVIILCITTRKFGRKLPFLFVCINTFTYNVVLYFSVTTTQILLSEIMQGVNHASNVTLSVIIVSEYTAPKYRGKKARVAGSATKRSHWLPQGYATTRLAMNQ